MHYFLHHLKSLHRFLRPDSTSYGHFLSRPSCTGKVDMTRSNMVYNGSTEIDSVHFKKIWYHFLNLRIICKSVKHRKSPLEQLSSFSSKIGSPVIFPGFHLSDCCLCHYWASTLSRQSSERVPTMKTTLLLNITSAVVKDKVARWSFGSMLI